MAGPTASWGATVLRRSGFWEGHFGLEDHGQAPEDWRAPKPRGSLGRAHGELQETNTVTPRALSNADSGKIANCNHGFIRRPTCRLLVAIISGFDAFDDRELLAGEILDRF